MSMPDFLVLGPGKTGTTSLYSYLAEHPQISVSAIKEPNFFEFGEPDEPPRPVSPQRAFAVKTLAAYQALFADSHPVKMRGEASPSNIEVRACFRISRYLPTARFICSIRHPVERAYSSFAMHRRDGDEPEADFLLAYRDSARRWERRFEEALVPYARRNARWYVERLRDWFARFRRQQFHIGLYEDLKTDSASYVRSLYGFLEVDDSFIPDLSAVRNQGHGVRSMGVNRFLREDATVKRWLRPWVPGSARRAIVRRLLDLNRAPLPPLDPQIRWDLTLPQRDAILRLQDLVGRDLTHWLAR